MEIFATITNVQDGGDSEDSSSCRKKEKCPDCAKCLMCSESKCRLCRAGAHHAVDDSGLGRSFTYGQYLEWKKSEAVE